MSFDSKFHSIVLMAFVYVDYERIWLIGVGSNGCASAHILQTPELMECIEIGTIGFHLADSLPNYVQIATHSNHGRHDSIFQ